MRSRERLGNRRQDSGEKGHRTPRALETTAAVRSFSVKEAEKWGRVSAMGFWWSFRGMQSLLVASGDSGLGERDVHWHLPQSLVPRSPLVPAGPNATPSRKPSLSPGAGHLPPEQASQGHSPLSTLICGHYVPDALGISPGLNCAGRVNERVWMDTWTERQTPTSL